MSDGPPPQGRLLRALLVAAVVAWFAAGLALGAQPSAGEVPAAADAAAEAVRDALAAGAEPGDVADLLAAEGAEDVTVTSVAGEVVGFGTVGDGCVAVTARSGAAAAEASRAGLRDCADAEVAVSAELAAARGDAVVAAVADTLADAAGDGTGLRSALAGVELPVGTAWELATAAPGSGAAVRLGPGSCVLVYADADGSWVAAVDGSTPCRAAVAAAVLPRGAVHVPAPGGGAAS